MVMVGPGAAVCDQHYKHRKNTQIFTAGNMLAFNLPVYNP